MRHSAVPFAFAFAFASAFCAKALPPPGGAVDRAAPAIAEVTPTPGSVTTNLRAPVVIRFDERIAERGLRELVVVSPETGDPIIDKGRDNLKVSLPGGWARDVVYSIVLLPGVSDMFGNATDTPLEIVFSTGPEVPQTTLAGIVTDRVTGKPAPARIEAVRLPDSIRYVSGADDTGFFVFRSIPAGEYLVRAYTDVRRNRRLDFADPVDSAQVTVTATDTVTLEFSLLAADTTPARVLRAEARDSMQIRVTLDDYIDPADPVALILEASLWRLGPAGTEGGDSVAVDVDVVMLPKQFDAQRAAQRSDTTRAAPARPQGALPQTPARPQLGAAAEAPADTAAALPTRELVVVPEAPLTPNHRYRITLTRVRNIAGLTDGGGSVTFTTPAARRAPATTPAAPPEPAAADTSSALRLPVDTTGVQRPQRAQRR